MIPEINGSYLRLCRTETAFSGKRTYAAEREAVNATPPDLFNAAPSPSGLIL